ncbi:hypothetical protein DPMN_149465 [Dreissena polymorpha]|uniref:Uncharacterized protein n=1 Tax=Dreissena polymorpha TaxID=45954 RepID=A0A9D4J501_DREPO|nr:hypothetical protein DPMN_149465 [Dreissena polymorpha]
MDPGLPVYMDPTLSICSFSAANSDTEPKTSLNSFRYRLLLSMLPGKHSKIMITWK